MNKKLNIKLLFILLSTFCIFLWIGSGDNPFDDIESIKDTDYALIRIEMQRCIHIKEDGSILANLRFSPIASCLKHLEKRILITGKAEPSSQLNI